MMLQMPLFHSGGNRDSRGVRGGGGGGGGVGARTTDFLKDLGHCLRQVSDEANSFSCVLQRLPVAEDTAPVLERDDKFFVLTLFMFLCC